MVVLDQTHYAKVAEYVEEHGLAKAIDNYQEQDNLIMRS